MKSLLKRLPASALTLTLCLTASAAEVYPAGPTRYGPYWRPGAGSVWHPEVYPAGPSTYSRDPSRSEHFPRGPVGYGWAPGAGAAGPQTPIMPPAQPVRPELFPPGAARYGPCWRMPYYGYPYPPYQAPKEAVPAAPSTPAAQPPTTPQRREPTQPTAQAPLSVGPSTAPEEEAAALPRPPAEPEAVISVGSPLDRDLYRQEGNIIHGPEGSAYRSFGKSPQSGTTYQRSGNMLYGLDTRCRIIGNTAVCW